MDKLKLWALAAKCGDYENLASRLASNYQLSRQIIVEALDDITFSNEFLMQVFMAVDDGDAPSYIAAFRYDRIVELLYGKFERIAQEIIAEYLLEELEMPSQNRDGSEQ